MKRENERERTKMKRERERERDRERDRERERTKERDIIRLSTQTDEALNRHKTSHAVISRMSHYPVKFCSSIKFKLYSPIDFINLVHRVAS